MRVCYVVGPGDPGDQLRYSLRSLQNIEHDGVTIAGYIPRWVTNVEALPVRQTGGKQANIRNNLRAICERYDQWILFQDDIFVTRPADIEIVSAGTVRNLVEFFRKRGPLTPYVLDIKKTGEFLESMGYQDPLSFDCIHMPQIIVSEHMLAAIELAEKNNLGAVLTIHGNLAGYYGPKVTNAKSDTGWSRRTFVSTSDKRWPKGVGEYIRDLFPERCPYER